MLFTGSNVENVLNWINSHKTFGLCGDEITRLADYLPEDNCIRLEGCYRYSYAFPGDEIIIPDGDFAYPVKPKT